MSPRDHNKVLGTAHLIFGGMNALALLASAGFFSPGGAAGVLRRLNPVTSVRLGLEAEPVFLVIFLLLFSLPSLIAGFGMLKRKSWAQGAGVIASIAASLNPPLGTALCVYSLWFLFGDGKHFYESSAEGEWHDAATASPFEGGAKKANGNGQAEYEPPEQPPNWRD